MKQSLKNFYNALTDKAYNYFIISIAFLSLFTSIRLFSNLIGSIDFVKELEKNQQLNESSEEKKQKTKKNIIDLTAERGFLLRKKMLKSAIWLFLAILTGYVICFIQLEYEFNKLLSLLKNSFMTIMSVFFFALGTLGRLGWEGQSYSGETVYEKLDIDLLWINYFLGCIFCIIALL